MLLHLDGATIQVANFVNYNCQPSRRWQVTLCLLAATFYHLLINFANSFDLDQDQQNVGPDLYQTLLHPDSIPQRFKKK